ncbi:MAG: hypothetical protein KGS61_03765, partial [Verrucomicrobia bacterium]|nr:hypothetical protein [Verrucomicrobiota bacterium]
ITRGNLISDREVVFERKAPLGLTGFEAVMLMRRFEDPGFLSFGRSVSAPLAIPAPPPPVRRGPPAH